MNRGARSSDRIAHPYQKKIGGSKMKAKSKNAPNQQEIIMAFLRVIAAKPSKRYPVFVWKVPSIFPDDLHIMFDRWLSQSKYRDSCPFAKKKHFFQAPLFRFR